MSRYLCLLILSNLAVLQQSASSFTHSDRYVNSGFGCSHAVRKLQQKRELRTSNSAIEPSSSNVTVQNITGRKWPKFKLNKSNGIALALSVLGAVLANAAGVGGGGMFVPMFTLLGFDAKTATALSQAMITGGSFVSFLYNIGLQHPTEKRPLIDYDLALLLEPMLLFGISLGVLFNIVFPDWLILGPLTLLLTYMAIRTTRKGLSTWAAESKKISIVQSQIQVTFQPYCQKISQLAEVHQDDEEENRVNSKLSERESTREVGQAKGVDPASDDVIMTESSEDSHTDEDPAGSPLVKNLSEIKRKETKAIWMTETRIIPKKRLLEMFTIWVIFFGLQILKGGRTHSSAIGIKNCQKWFLIVLLLQLPLCLFSTLWVAQRLHKEHTFRTFSQFDDAEVQKVQHGIQWTSRQLAVYPVIALLAGALAGLLGIGGGMVIGPLLLELGVLPQIAAATGALMVLFSSSMAVAQFVMLQLIPLEYGLVYGTTCAISAGVGLVSVRIAIAKYGRNSIIIFALAFVIGASAFVIAITGGIKVLQQLLHNDYMGFEPLCLSG